MRIRYTGPSHHRRVVGNHTWCEENDMVQEVTDPELLLDLLTYPGPKRQFVVAPDEPLLALPGLTDTLVPSLVLLEVYSVDDLVGLSKTATRGLARQLSVPTRKVGAWVRVASKRPTPPPAIG